jgi:hypothetical protein
LLLGSVVHFSPSQLLLDLSYSLFRSRSRVRWKCAVEKLFSVALPRERLVPCRLPGSICLVPVNGGRDVFLRLFLRLPEIDFSRCCHSVR